MIYFYALRSGRNIFILTTQQKEDKITLLSNESVVNAIRIVNEQLREAVLRAGKAEFFRCGFEKATMREIAKAAGVTTGAVYCYFPNKMALFEEPVAAPAKGLKEEFEAHVAQMDKDMTEDATSYNQWVPNEPNWLVEYIYENYDAFKLLVCHSCGTSYAHYMDSLVEIEVESTLRFISYLRAAGLLSREIDEELVHIIASAQFVGIFEPIAHDMSREKAKAHILALEEFYSAGWRKILGL